MTIGLINLTIADCSLLSVHGRRIAGAYGVGIVIEFSILQGFPAGGPFPVVFFVPANVQLEGRNGPLNLGKAVPENPMPFRVTQFPGGKLATTFELVLSPAAFDVLEEQRQGGGLTLRVRLQAEVRHSGGVDIVWEDAVKQVTQSDWLRVHEGCGYGRSMLFEVPLPEANGAQADWAKTLETARTQFLRGRYADCVGTCRRVLEVITTHLGQDADLSAAKRLHKADPRKLDVAQRELILRQTAVDFCHLAHHTNGGVAEELYDRRSAQMMLAVVASLVSSALGRAQEIQLRSLQP
jgi:hypothetical protein